MLLKEVKGIGPKTEENLTKLGIYKAEDLSLYLPTRYIDLSLTTDAKDFVVGDFVFCKLTLTDVKPLVKRGRHNFTIAYATYQEEKIRLVWYNLPYVSMVLKKGVTIFVYGKLSFDGTYRLVNPQFEKEKEVKNLQGIRAVYKTKGLVPQTTLSRLIMEALKVCCPIGAISRQKEEEYCLMPFVEGVRKAHFPTSINEAEDGKRRVLIDRAVAMIRAYKEERASLPTIKSHSYGQPFGVLKSVIDGLPFELSPSQKDALKGILSGLKGASPLNTLLEGDVGSGKTAVALTSAAYVARCGGQTALLVPTTILGAQHYETAKRLIKDGLRVALLTSATKASARNDILMRVARGDVDLLIGTQSILSDKIVFNNLTYVIVDEQQKFGVKDREALLDRTKDLDCLSMTATPIPRTLGLVYFGGTDVVRLETRDERKIDSYVIPLEKQADMMEYIVKRVENGEKAFIVAPAIEDIEGVETSGVDGIYQSLEGRLGSKVALLHGKLKEDEKLSVMRAFREGDVGLVVATSVVEVGVDVPEASYLVVMHADRFGLSTLHQIRGRIGRLGQKAECFLYTEARGEALSRLKTFAKMTDGQEIASFDFEERGAGQLLGVRQSGDDKALAGITLSDLRLASQIEDVGIR